jgi:hypothetical protein
MTQETPTEHSSLVGGSTAARRINCPRSYALEKLAPPDKGNAYAREGTALHEMIAIVLDKDKDAEELLPFTHKQEAKGAEEPWELTIDADLWADLGQPALDAFMDFMDEIEADQDGAEFEYLIETRCAMPGIDGAFGTTDVVWKCGDLSGVWDWKFGRTPVAADSDQLRFYGRSAAADHPKMFGGESWGDLDPDREVFLNIMQPQCSSEPAEHITTIGELEDFRVELMAAITEAQEQGEKARIAKGGWCTFATCKSVCPLHIGRSLEFGEKMAKLAALKEAQGEKELRDVTYEDPYVDGVGSQSFGDMAPDLLELAEIAEEFAREVFKQAHAWVEEGNDLDGWGLKKKRSSGRVFTVSDEEVQSFMKNRRYKLDDYMPRKMLTMPQVEKLLARDGRVLPEEMYEAKPSSGTTLVRVGDAELVGSKTQRVAALAQKLGVAEDAE